jgi:tetratricopeptide (TPR) repeat protein
MSCNDYRQAIAEFVDGTLDAAGQRELERHVAACADCRALVADLKTIQAAAFTLERREPPAHAWNAIRERVAAEPVSDRGRVLAWPRTRTAWGVWMAAAAALLLVTTAGIVSIVNEPPPTHQDERAADTTPQPANIESIQAEFQAATEHYEKAISGLEQIAKQQSGDLDPQVAAVLQKNLQVIDQAIGDSRAALNLQPTSSDAQDSLFDAMRTKVAVLQQTVELINEMRKGNQAEAGRLIQGLNQ